MRWLETPDGLGAINPAHLTSFEVVEKFSRHLISAGLPQKWEVRAFTTNANLGVDYFILGTYETQRDARDSMNCFLDQIGVIE